MEGFQAHLGAVGENLWCGCCGMARHQGDAVGTRCLSCLAGARSKSRGWSSKEQGFPLLCCRRLFLFLSLPLAGTSGACSVGLRSHSGVCV